MKLEFGQIPDSGRTVVLWSSEGEKKKGALQKYLLLTLFKLHLVFKYSLVCMHAHVQEKENVTSNI